MLSFACAEIESIGTIKKGECINLIQTCEDCTYVNITSITYPNKTEADTNIAMTKVATKYNYSFCDTDELGEYIYNTEGDLWGNTAVESLKFIVTPTGISQTTPQGINSAIYIILILCLTAFIGYVGIQLFKSDYVWILGIFFIFVMFLLMTYSVWLGYEYHLTLTGINQGSGVPEVIFYIFLFVIVSGLLTSGILLFTRWKEILKYWKRSKEEAKRERNEADYEWI